VIESLIRKHLAAFEPYKSARSEMHQARIFLDANELAAGSPVAFAGAALNRYPDPYQLELRTKLGEMNAVSADRVFAGVGSDEIIDLLIRLFCEPATDSIAILEPTYGVYRVAASLSAVKIIPIELDENFQIDVAATLRAVEPHTKLLFCCSPNNPTGNLLRRGDILKLCKEFNGIVVVDEAYVDFAEGKEIVSPADTQRSERLVILKTLSKAWGLAGIRLGYCLADPTIVSHLLRIKAPYSINVVTSVLALQALDENDFFKSSVKMIREERTRVAAELSKLPSVVKIYPSDGNYLLVEFTNRDSAFAALYAKGIVVRKRSEARLKKCLRITIGTPHENSQLLSALSA
jgi:histidinol-phosphate aminotransferase